MLAIARQVLERFYATPSPSDSPLDPPTSNATPIPAAKATTPHATNTPAAHATSEPTKAPICYLLTRLPAELRLQIYCQVLAPSSVLCLTSTNTHRRVIRPSTDLALLTTCKQIYQESRDLLFSENEFAITVDAHDTCWPTISPTRLPPHALQRIQHLCLILDCTGHFFASYQDVDFSALSALVQLKTLRLSVIFDSSTPVIQIMSLQRGDELAEEILSRVPKATQVICHLEEGSLQQEFAEKLLCMHQRKSKRPETVLALPEDELEGIMATVPDEVRGLHSGLANAAASAPVLW